MTAQRKRAPRKRSTPKKQPEPQYKAFSDVTKREMQFHGERILNEDWLASGERYVLERYEKRKSQYPTAGSDSYVLMQLRSLEDDAHSYFRTGSASVIDDLERVAPEDLGNITIKLVEKPSERSGGKRMYLRLV
jgi:hypothetical protein